MAPMLGAEVEGVDFSRPLAPEIFEQVLAAFHEHLVLVFRGQELDAHRLAAATEQFGPLTLGLLIARGREHPFVSDLIRDPDVPADIPNVGGIWHSDQSVREDVSLGFMLYCVECPPYGGDTLFSSLYGAYERLSPGMQALCDRLTVIHSPSVRLGLDGKKLKGIGGDGPISAETRRVLASEVEHPLVRVHPDTGRKLLFVNRGYTSRFGGMTPEESAPLLDYLQNEAARPELTCRVRWQPGTLVLNDNRATLHYALNDYRGHRRHMMRAEIAGDRPYGPAMPRRPAARRSA